MGLSKRYIDTQEEAFSFDPEQLAREMKERLPAVVFAYLMGSAAEGLSESVAEGVGRKAVEAGDEGVAEEGTEGLVRPHSDLDLAVYLDPKCLQKGSSFDLLEFYSTAQQVVEDVVGPVRCDLGILNGVEPVYRFEALCGRLLFSRDEDLRASFFSLTCREYEHQLFDYERQRRYRLEAAGAADPASEAKKRQEEAR